MAPDPELLGIADRLRARLLADEDAPPRDTELYPPEAVWIDPPEVPVVAVPAAVLVPIVDVASGPRLVLTRRAGDLRTHGGEISFPGGRVDKGETDREAALREAHEELGIEPGEVDVLGHLPRVPTVVSGYLIAPWVGVVREPDLVPNPGEIAEVIEVPLLLLLEPGARRDQRFIRRGHMYRSPAFDLGPHTVWGATGRILAALVDLLAEQDCGSQW